LVACPLAVYVSINPFGTAAAAILDVILFTGLGQDRTLFNEAGYYTLDQGYLGILKALKSPTA
jgi:hypothetical protein